MKTVLKTNMSRTLYNVSQQGFHAMKQGTVKKYIFTDIETKIKINEVD